MNDKKRKIKKEIVEDEGESRDSRGFEALAELTSSDVIQQVKNGMSRLAPLDADEDDSEEASF